MFQLTGLFEARVELLLAIVTMVLAVVRRVIVTVRLKHVPTLFRQHNRHVPMTIQPLGSDEPVVTQMSQVAGPRICGAVAVVADVARGDNPKRADGGQRPRFKPVQRVLTPADIVDDFSVASTRKIETPHEHVTRIPRVVIAVRPALVVPMARVVLRVIVAIV